jgi:hypothetical protein
LCRLSSLISRGSCHRCCSTPLLWAAFTEPWRLLFQFITLSCVFSAVQIFSLTFSQRIWYLPQRPHHRKLHTDLGLQHDTLQLCHLQIAVSTLQCLRLSIRIWAIWFWVSHLETSKYIYSLYVYLLRVSP